MIESYLRRVWPRHDEAIGGKHSASLSLSVAIGAFSGLSMFALTFLALPADWLSNAIPGAINFVAAETSHHVHVVTESASGVSDEDIENFLVYSMLAGTAALFYFLFVARDIKKANWTVLALNITVGTAGEWGSEFGMRQDTLYAILFLNLASMLIAAFFLLFAGAFKRALRMFGTAIFWFLVYGLLFGEAEPSAEQAAPASEQETIAR